MIITYGSILISVEIFCMKYFGWISYPDNLKAGTSPAID
jgi:hypothetical protein